MAAAARPPAAPAPTAGALRVVLAVVVATLVALGVNALIATAARGLGAPAEFGPLTFSAWGLFTVIGVVVGCIAWLGLWRVVPRPGRTLGVLWVVLLVASFSADLQFLGVGVLPAVTLMVMHVVVAGAVAAAMAVTGRAPFTR